MSYLSNLKLEAQDNSILFSIPVDILGWMISMLDVISNCKLGLTCSRLRMLCRKYLIVIYGLDSRSVRYYQLLSWSEYIDKNESKSNLHNVDCSSLTIRMVSPYLIYLLPKFNTKCQHYTISPVAQTFQKDNIGDLLRVVGDYIEKHDHDLIIELEKPDLPKMIHTNPPDESGLTQNKSIPKIMDNLEITYIDGLLKIAIFGNKIEQYDFSYIVSKAKIVDYELLMYCEDDIKIDAISCHSDQITCILDQEDDTSSFWDHVKVIYHNIRDDRDEEGYDDTYIDKDVIAAIDRILSDRPDVKIIVQTNLLLNPELKAKWLTIRDNITKDHSNPNIEFNLEPN